MSIEQQINVQELQRLNDAIVVTMEAIRRVVPQIAALQQHAQQMQQSAPLGGQSLGGQAYGSPFLGGPAVGYGQQVPGYASPFANVGAQAGGIGQPLGGFGPQFSAQFGGMGGGTPWNTAGAAWAQQPMIDPATLAGLVAHAQVLRSILAQPQMQPGAASFGLNVGYGPQVGQGGLSPWAAQGSPYSTMTQRTF